ncbi:ABC transporter ATP-binding protein [Brachybacterium fresconis]|uniref:ABC transport system ATP-binding protein n=1 Tax=Brachybacterium fresconis TaxID=173363 RepID=A0ABS4YNR8_9MICO|nr:ABC transporter ATP-binding protein [Brachybacterium fresconis]MBP2410437.1 putative ABC transport system ATP-binding protein [Brachybacterium fresconis]
MTADLPQRPARPFTPGVTPAAVTARALTKIYGRGAEARTVLDHVDLEISPGTLTAIIGPSGSGKSTLLFCLAGLEHPSNGQVDLLGVDPSRSRPALMARLYRSRVGFVFQDFNLVPYLSARRNAALPGLLAHRSDALPRADAALAELGISDHASTLSSRLSGGQQQRTALARVLAGRPDVVFADEPTGALDSASSAVVMQELKARANDGSAVVLATHDLDAAARADRVVLLTDGRVRAVHGSTTAPVLAELLDEVGR